MLFLCSFTRDLWGRVLIRVVGDWSMEHEDLLRLEGKSSDVIVNETHLASICLCDFVGKKSMNSGTFFYYHVTECIIPLVSFIVP